MRRDPGIAVVDAEMASSCRGSSVSKFENENRFRLDDMTDSLGRYADHVACSRRLRRRDAKIIDTSERIELSMNFPREDRRHRFESECEQTLFEPIH